MAGSPFDVDDEPEPFVHATPTIDDVARRAGVSRQTVSNVMNAPRRVKLETRKNVRAAIEELGYRANRHARNLRTRSSRVIAYCLPPANLVGTPVMDAFLHTLVETGYQNGYNTLLTVADTRTDEIDRYAEMAATSTADGVIFAFTSPDDPRPAALRELGLPFASFGRTNDPVGHGWVDVDGAAGTRLATAHLIGKGHRRFVSVGHNPDAFGTRERRRGVAEAMSLAGLRPEDLRTIDLVEDDEPVTEQVRSLLNEPDPPTAFVTGSDWQAAAVIAALEACRKVPGKDIAVTGFDDLPLAAHLGGGLTTLRQPLEAAAGELVRQLTRQFLNPSAPYEQALLEPTLIVRNTG